MKNKFINSIINRIFGSDIIELETNIANKEAEISRLKTLLDSTKSKLSHTTRALTSTQSELTSVTTERNEALSTARLQRTVREDREEEIAKLKDNIVKLRQKQDTLSLDKRSLTEASSKLNQQNEELRAFLSEKEEMIANLQASATSNADTISKLETDIKEKCAEISSLKSECDSKSSIIAESEATIVKLQTNIANQVDKNSALESDISTKEAEIDSIKSERDSLYSNLREKENALVSSKDELAKANELANRQRQEIDGMVSKISDLEHDIESLKPQNKSSDEMRDQIDQLQFELREKDSTVSKLNTEVENLNRKLTSLASERERILSEIEDKNAYISEIEKRFGEKTALYEEELKRNQNLENTISALQAELEALRGSKPSAPGELPNVPQHPSAPESPKQPNEGSATVIKGPTKQEPIQRTIDEILEVDTGELIPSDDIFSKSEQYIIGMRHVLSEAVKTGRPKWVCPYCNQMVRIVGRNGREGTKYFFSHLYDSGDCDIKTISFATQTYINFSKYAQEGATHQYLKETIAELLKLNKSIEKGVSDVEIERKVFGDHPLFKWRQPDVSAKYRDLNLVFELQLSYTFLDVIAQRDLFYRNNNHYILWVSYLGDNPEEINFLAHKYLYFTNKRNIFIIDNESIAESRRKGELVLKCNWVNAQNEWHFPITTKHVSGCFVTLSDLKYDSVSHKPYYYDAEEEFFTLHPEAIIEEKRLEDDLQSRINRLLGNGVKTEDEHKQKMSPDVTPSLPYDTVTYTNRNISIVKKENNYGIVDSNNNIMVPIVYNEILPFNDTLNLFRAKSGYKWGVINGDNEHVLSFDFASIGTLSDGKAPVKDLLDWDGYIDGNARLMPSIVKTLEDGYEIIQIHQNIGLRKYKNILLPVEYSKIEQIDNTGVILFSNQTKRGIFSLKNEKIKECPFDKILTAFDGKYLSIVHKGEIVVLESQSLNLVIANLYRFHPIEPINKAIIQKVEDRKWYIFDMISHSVISGPYKQLHSTPTGLFMATADNGLRFMLDAEGKPIETNVSVGKFNKTSVSGLVGLSTEDGKELIAPEYIDVCSYRGKIAAIKSEEVHFYDIDNDNRVSMEISIKGKKGCKWFATVGSRTVIINGKQSKKAVLNGLEIKIGAKFPAYITHVSFDGSLVYVGLVFGGRYIRFDTKHYHFENIDNNIQ